VVPAVAAPPLIEVKKKPSRLAELWSFRQLVFLLVARELKVRYKRSVLGVLWTMLNPLLLMVVYAVVFTTIMPAALPNFAIFLLAGLLPWIYFSTALLQGLMSVLVNQELVRKVRVPQAVFPISVVGSNLVNLGLSLVPLFVMMLAIRQRFTAALLFLRALLFLLAHAPRFVGEPPFLLLGALALLGLLLFFRLPLESLARPLGRRSRLGLAVLLLLGLAFFLFAVGEVREIGEQGIGEAFRRRGRRWSGAGARL